MLAMLTSIRNVNAEIVPDVGFCVRFARSTDLDVTCIAQLVVLDINSEGASLNRFSFGSYINDIFSA